MYRYKITIETLPHEPTEKPDDHQECVFEAKNHDDVLAIIAAVRTKEIADEDSSAALALGLKLLSEVVLARRTETLFADIWPPLQEFTRRLKAVRPAERIKT